jgi:hypothetical protein
MKMATAEKDRLACYQKDKQCQAGRLINNAQSLRVSPFPVANLGQILAASIDVLLMLDEFVLHLLLQIIPLNIHLGQTINDILHEVKPVQLVLHSHVKGGCGSRSNGLS